MKTAEFCIKHRVTTILAFIMVVIFGLMSFQTLPLALMPNIELPMAIVMTTYAGAGPQEIENLVTKPVEQACARVSGMDEIQSSSAENMSMVMVTFVDGTDMDQATLDMREKIDLIKGSLPDDAAAPTVMAMDPDAMPVVQIGLTGADLAQLQSIAEDTISPALERVAGVASVDIYGGYSNHVVVDTYANRLAGYGLSVSYISQILGAENIAVPAGDVQNGTKKLTVRTDGEYSSLADIENTLIPLPRGGSVRLGEIADVRMEPEDIDSIVNINNTSALALSVNKQSGTNTVQIADKVKAELAKLAKDNPGLQYEIVMDQSDYINESVDTVIQNIVLGVILAGIVLFLFLRNFGATAVIAVAMPICIISVFLIMKALGITMNMMSLGGMAMGVGMIVDNSIVVLENIFSFRSDGASRWDACVKGTSEVALAISASTLTTVAVFLPLGFTSGMVGMMFKEFSLTIVALLLSSLIIALTLVPLMCYILLDRREGRKVRVAGNEERQQLDKPIMRTYKRILKFFITRRAIAMLISVVMIGAFVVSIAGAGMEMMPSMDQGSVSVSIGMPIGAQLEETQEVADRISQIAEDTIPELDTMYYTISNGSSLMGSSSSVSINLVPMKDRDRSSEEVANQLRNDLADIAGAELSISAGGGMDMSSMTGDAISVSISGDDYDVLTDAADDLVKALSAVPGAIEVKSSSSERVPQVNIYMNRENASRFGLTAATVGQAVRGELTGASATKLRVSGDEITVDVRGDMKSGQSLDALRSIPIPTQTGGSVPLSLVADVNVELAPQQIARSNQSRTLTITGSSLSDDITTVNLGVQQVLADYELPDGVTFETGGEMEEMMESFGSLGFALIVALGLVYFVLASQFESFIMPIIIMTILPIGLLGALFGLPVTGHPISVPAFIGVIVLAGTVVNSSIVLIDYINTRREHYGEDKNDAILSACPRRVRPVLMTTLTTILGLVPMAMGLGEGSEMMVPMAVVMITGMIISTIVTLFFTPVYYSLIDSLTHRRPKNKKKRGRKDKGAPPSEEPPQAGEAQGTPTPEQP